MYDNQKALRRAAQEAAKKHGYSVEVLKGTGGARLRLTKGGTSVLALVRTSSDGWLGWMRNDEGEWRGIDDGQLIIAAVLDSKEPSSAATIYALKPEDVRKAFDDNLAAREAAGPLKKTAPVFVCMGEPVTKGPAAVGGNLGAKAMWKLETPLDATEPAPSKTKETKEGFAARVRQEFADLIGVSVDMVSVDFKVSL